MEAQDFQFNFMGYPQGAPQAPQQPQTQQQSRAALENELRMNEAKINELKAKLNSNRATADGIDRQLAANRAGIGDIASSQAHQRAIDERAYRNAMAANAAATSAANAVSAKQERVRKLVEDLEQAYIDKDLIAPTGSASVQNKINRLEKEYKELTGDDYVYTGAENKKGQVEGGAEVADVTSVKSKLAGMKDKLGVINNEQKAELLKDIEKVPLSQESVDLFNEIKGMKTSEDLKDDDSKARAKEKAAIYSVKGSVSAYKLGKGATTVKAKNGLTVNVERSGGVTTYTCGKTSVKE